MNTNVNYSDLAKISTQIAEVTTVNIKAFKAMSVSQNDVNEMLKNASAFVAHDFDPIKLGLLHQKVKETNGKAATLRTTFKAMVQRLRRDLGSQVIGEYPALKFANLRKTNQDRLVHYTLETVQLLKEVDVFTDYVAKYPAAIEKLETLASEMSALITARDLLRKERKEATDKRKELYQNTYELMMYIAEVGKDIFRNTNRALYDEFVIYHNMYSPQPAATENDSGEVFLEHAA